MEIVSEWQKILDENPQINEMFLEQKKYDEYEIIPPYFLHYFRPRNYGILKDFFLPFKHGQEIFEKLKEIYDVTADNYEHEDGSVAAYFIPKKDNTVSEKELKKIAKNYANSINDILEDYNEESIDINTLFLKVEIMDSQTFNDKYDEEEILEADLYEIKGEWFSDYFYDDDLDNPLKAFDEPLYNVACDYNIARYVMWPLLEINKFENPFKWYFELWKLGYRPYFITNRLLVLVI